VRCSYEPAVRRYARICVYLEDVRLSAVIYPEIYSVVPSQFEDPPASKRYGSEVFNERSVAVREIEKASGSLIFQRVRIPFGPVTHNVVSVRRQTESDFGSRKDLCLTIAGQKR